MEGTFSWGKPQITVRAMRYRFPGVHRVLTALVDSDRSTVWVMVSRTQLLTVDCADQTLYYRDGQPVDPLVHLAGKPERYLSTTLLPHRPGIWHSTIRRAEPIMDIDSVYRLCLRDVFLFLQGLTHNEALAEETDAGDFLQGSGRPERLRRPAGYTGVAVHRWPATPIIPTATGQSTLPRWKMPKRAPAEHFRNIAQLLREIRMRPSLYISVCTRWMSLTKRCYSDTRSIRQIYLRAHRANLRPRCRMGPGDLLPGQDPTAKDAFLFHLTFPITAEHPGPKARGCSFCAQERNKQKRLCRSRAVKVHTAVNQRLLNWGARRAAFRPYFLRSFIRGSRVRKPAFFRTGRFSSLCCSRARLRPWRIAPA